MMRERVEKGLSRGGGPRRELERVARDLRRLRNTLQSSRTGNVPLEYESRTTLCLFQTGLAGGQTSGRTRRTLSARRQARACPAARARSSAFRHYFTRPLKLSHPLGRRESTNLAAPRRGSSTTTTTTPWRCCPTETRRRDHAASGVSPAESVKPSPLESRRSLRRHGACALYGCI